MTSQTFSVDIDNLSLEELVQLSQGLGHQAEKLREQRQYLRRKIDERLALGERTSSASTTSMSAGDAVAPGAVIDAGLQA